MKYKVVFLDNVKDTYKYSGKRDINSVFTNCYRILLDKKLQDYKLTDFEEGLNLICSTFNWKLVSLTLYGPYNYDGQSGVAVFEVLEDNSNKESI